MHNKRTYQCPVCGCYGLTEPPLDEYGCASFEICPCWGTEFGYHDTSRSHVELRTFWLAQGAHWFSTATTPPANWDPRKQLEYAGLADR
jgi:hypothetical protein